MGPSEAVVDSSVLLAVLLNEPGGAAAATLSIGATISAVNLAEVISRAVERGATADAVLNAAEELAMAVAPFGPDDAVVTGELRRTTRHLGISLGDRACLALARRLEAVVYTADRRWSDLNIGIDIRLIR